MLIIDIPGSSDEKPLSKEKPFTSDEKPDIISNSPNPMMIIAKHEPKDEKPKITKSAVRREWAEETKQI